MIEFVRLDLPFGGFHQKLRIVILVGEEGIEGQSDPITLLADPAVANSDGLGSKSVSHEPVPSARMLSA